jgi:hypothetical protein
VSSTGGLCGNEPIASDGLAMHPPDEVAQHTNFGTKVPGFRGGCNAKFVHPPMLPATNSLATRAEGSITAFTERVILLIDDASSSADVYKKRYRASSLCSEHFLFEVLESLFVEQLSFVYLYYIMLCSLEWRVGLKVTP